MYNSRDRLSIIRQLEDADRPYCGYLFTKYTREKFINSNQLLGYDIEAGVTGKWSLGEQFQSWYHGNIGVNNFKYWAMQIPNSFGMNVTVKYSTSITSSDKQYQLFKIVPTTEATLGNFFINAKAGAYFCMGVFEKNENWFRGFSNLARRVSGASKIVLVDSFNDWNRGTQLESADTYGEDFLQILKEEFKVN